MLSARPRCSPGDVLAWVWTCSNSLNSLSELHSWALKRFSALHLLCIQGSTKLASSRLWRSLRLLRTLSVSQMVEMMPVLSTSTGYCSRKPFRDVFPNDTVEKQLLLKRCHWRNQRKLTDTFLPGCFAVFLNEWRKEKKKKNIQTTVNGEFRLLWKDFLGRWRSLATLRAMEIHRTCVDQRIWTDWLPPVSKETSLPVGLYQHRDFWSHRLYISH